ncbi:MAG: 1-(5-phosphoribosyl)-5-[(5-phosphoribosylamino)methylideneamino]imidazole-4-carboxamide isomerase [Actinomycetota bacterium]|nr:1-(5-phosphoribosyl)-5-[(5-phosphoribosylamino)methylideneamino]imidazole-4-carboxamide isomerase [Actinomycetota bacterium]
MDLYPAIDLRDGRVVRLQQGDYDRETQYSDDPVAVAQRFEAAGARWIHVVDLDAARSGIATNRDAIRSICNQVSAKVQSGGGVRDAARAEALLEAGVKRVVVGTAAVEHPELVDELALRFPGRVAVGLDARGRDVATHGWETATGADLVDLARRFDRPGVGALVVTEIGRDGMLAGPDVEQLATVLGAVRVPVIASGGVATEDDLHLLAALEVEGRRLAGVIAGRAIYEGRFTVEEGVAACSPSA